MTRQPIAWVDGLRGLSSLGVLSSHLSTIFSQESFSACCSPGTSVPSYRQLPPLRLLAVGHAWLAMFFILSGFVIGIRVLELAEGTLGLKASGRDPPSSADAYLARSTWKRPLRLMLPAACATAFAWVVAQCYLFIPAQKVGSLLLSMFLEQHRPWPEAIKHLFLSIVRTWKWLGPENPYDNMQWSMVYMLQGSFLCSTVLLATLHLKSPVRLVIMLGVWYVGWDWSRRLVDPIITPTYMTGLILAHMHPSPSFILISPLLLILGVILMCFPKNSAENVWWSNMIMKTHVQYMPTTLDIERGVSYFGCTLVLLAVLMSPFLRRFLSSRYLQWLGRISFGVYLIHMTLLRILLPWLAYIKNPINVFKRLPQSLHDSDLIQKPVPLTRLIAANIVTVLIILLVADIWSRTIDPICEKVIGMIEKSCTRNHVTDDDKLKQV